MIHDTYHIGLSSNRKTGPMFVSTSNSGTCPPSCPHLQQNTCYAKFSFLGMHWRKLDKGFGNALDWNGFILAVKKIPSGYIWRHNQSGDLPGKGEKIDTKRLSELVAANKGRKGFTYTHKIQGKSNLKAVALANAGGFTVNCSADSLDHAVELFNQGFPTVCTVPADMKENFEHGGVKFVCCPQVYKDLTCVECQLCQKVNRAVVVTFPAHGARKRVITLKEVK